MTSQLPGLVGEERAPRAFGLDSLRYNVASMAGPAVAGLAAAVDPRVAQAVLAGCAVLGAVGVSTLPLSSGPPSAARSGPGLLSGVQEICSRPTPA